MEAYRSLGIEGDYEAPDPPLSSLLSGQELNYFVVLCNTCLTSSPKQHELPKSHYKLIFFSIFSHNNGQLIGTVTFFSLSYSRGRE